MRGNSKYFPKKNDSTSLSISILYVKIVGVPDLTVLVFGLLAAFGLGRAGGVGGAGGVHGGLESLPAPLDTAEDFSDPLLDCKAMVHRASFPTKS